MSLNKPKVIIYYEDFFEMFSNPVSNDHCVAKCKVAKEIASI